MFRIDGKEVKWCKALDGYFYKQYVYSSIGNIPVGCKILGSENDNTDNVIIFSENPILPTADWINHSEQYDWADSISLDCVIQLTNGYKVLLLLHDEEDDFRFATKAKGIYYLTEN